MRSGKGSSKPAPPSKTSSEARPRKCPLCGGTGERVVPTSDVWGSHVTIACNVCDGAGEVEETPFHEEEIAEGMKLLVNKGGFAL